MSQGQPVGLSRTVVHGPVRESCSRTGRACFSACTSSGQQGATQPQELRPGGEGWIWACLPVFGDALLSGGVGWADRTEIPLKSEQG